ncbi:MAG: TlyA family RNA methyltransferase [Clostridiales bacterium]|nr:TlyA family RNA methyltransferase [Clostridiales bacterium]
MSGEGKGPEKAKDKERADILLVRQGLAPSREKAKAQIMAGQVYEGANRIDKAGEMISVLKELRVKGRQTPYASRGGLKLAKALEVFPIDLSGLVVLDIGASTGGFTDCALQNGAAKVFAVDVGYGQLDWKLRQDPRVVVLEKTNARYLTPDAIGEDVDFVTIDVSFISLDKVLPPVPALLGAQGSGVALIKPQFEAGRGQVGKKGVVKDPSAHREVFQKVLAVLPGVGLEAYGATWSPVTGPQGNIEYLLWFGKAAGPDGKSGGGGIDPRLCGEIIEEAFAALKRPKSGVYTPLKM